MRVQPVQPPFDINALRQRLGIHGPLGTQYLPFPGQTTVPVIVPGAQGAVATGQIQAQKPTQIIVKQKVTQIVGGKERKKAVKRAKKGTLKAKKKEYAAVKKTVKHALMAAKKSHYTRENDKIKGMDKGARVSARKKLRADIKVRYSRLVKLLPSTGRMSLNDISSLINKIKKVKW